MLNVILTSDLLDSPTDHIFHQFRDLDIELDLHRITGSFRGVFAMDVACQQGTLTLPDTWFHSPLLKLAYPRIVETIFPELVLVFSTFEFEYPSVLSMFLQIILCVILYTYKVHMLRQF